MKIAKIRSTKKFYLFDFDGVLIDSKKNMKVSWEQVKKKFKLKKNFNSYFRLIGLPFQEILKKLNINDNLDLIEQEYYYQSKKNINKIKLYKGVKNTLSVLKKRGNGIGILTSKNRERSLKILKKLKIKVDILICPSKKYKGKPNNEILFKNLKKIKYTKNNIIYIGDVNIDYEFAKNCKIKFIFAKYGYGNLKNKPKYSVRSISDLLKSKY